MSANIVKKTDVAYIEDQMRLLASMKLSTNLVETHEVSVENGWKVLRKRDVPLKIYDFDPAGHTASIVQSQKYYTEKMFNQRERKGKYNDEDRLIGQTALGIEVGEVDDMINPF
jgi:hypothetical protein